MYMYMYMYMCMYEEEEIHVWLHYLYVYHCFPESMMLNDRKWAWLVIKGFFL